MPTEDYRFYHRDADGILNGPDSFSAEYDRHLVEQIQTDHPLAICEVWQGKRLVAKLLPNGCSPGDPDIQA